MSDARLPNFSALRAFEAAARHENFSRAAEELHLTHGAISHQVRALERELGLALFERHGKQVRITLQGAQYARQLAKAFADMAAASAALRRSPVHQRLTIAAIPVFAARWLAPRLGGFIERHPAINVVLQTGEQWLADGVEVVAHKINDAVQVAGVNSPVQLAELERAYQRRVADTLMEQGTRLADPARLDVRGELL
eukprot:gene18617-18487_t